MSDKVVKIVVYVPEAHADAVRQALGEAGAGKVGDYSFTSFSVKGTGRYLPEQGARPMIGEIGKLEMIAEERIETCCYEKDLDAIIDAVKRVHPYEEIAIDTYPLVLNPHEITYNKYRRE